MIDIANAVTLLTILAVVSLLFAWFDNESRPVVFIAAGVCFSAAISSGLATVIKTSFSWGWTLNATWLFVAGLILVSVAVSTHKPDSK